MFFAYDKFSISDAWMSSVHWSSSFAFNFFISTTLKCEFRQTPFLGENGKSCFSYCNVLFYILDEMSVGRKEAFETFRRDYPHNDTIEENKQTLKQR